MDAQTQLVAELYKTLNDAQKQEVCNMIDTLLSQQLKDQQSLDSHSAATENQDTLCHRLHNGLLDGRKRRFDVRSALLVAQHGKKLSVRRDDRTARKRWDLVIHRRIAV